MVQSPDVRPDPRRTMPSRIPRHKPPWTYTVSRKPNSVVWSHWDFRVNLLQQQSPAWLGYYFKPCALILQSKHCLQAQGWQAMFLFGFNFLLKSPVRWLMLSVPGISPRALLGLDTTIWEVSCAPWGVSWGFADNIAVFSTALRGQCGGQRELVLAFIGAGKRRKGQMWMLSSYIHPKVNQEE